MKTCYTIEEHSAIGPILDHLTRLFNGVREVTETDTIAVFDTFDWRLFNKGWLLLRGKDGYTIAERRSGKARCHLTVDDGRTRTFHWEFPKSGLCAALESVLDLRALLPLGAVHRQSVRYDLLNRDEKTVVRLAVETFSGQDTNKTVRHFRLIPVRGYARQAHTVAECLQQAALVPAEEPLPVLSVLALDHHPPGVYASKINIALEPEMTAAEAIRRILGHLVSVMQANLPGLRQGTDIEFLHDFRVAVRRARSLLSQMKGVLDAETAATLQQRLKVLGTATGNVRDLDVYLMKEDAYLGLLTEFLKPGIIALFRMLKRKRRHATNRMITAMNGADFVAALVELDGFSKDGPAPENIGPSGNKLIGGLAKAAIYKRYLRIIKRGGRITEATPDKKLHDLRIECKKLRYLLEFFTSLFPAKTIQAMVRQLKQLQDNLGEFNDLSVQQAFLVDQLGTIRAQTKQSVILAAATGGLITRLSIEQRQVRSRFLTVFEKFRAPENQERFTTLFSG